MRVFLVEDSALVAKRLERIITELCYCEVIGCSSEACHAIKQITRLMPDVVVIDLSLKTGSGFEVLGAVSGLPVRPLTIVLTNYPTAEFRRAALELGAQHFFDKSTEFDRVVDVMNATSARVIAA
jgi:two-component system OmpR family response regulator